jgi:hypothetical protein
VTGEVHRGTAVVAQPGAWANAPSSYGYTWQHLARGRWTSIAGASAQRYGPAATDLGLRLRVVVVASNDDGSASAASAPTLPVGATGVSRAASHQHASRKAASKAKASRVKARSARRRHGKRKKKH